MALFAMRAKVKLREDACPKRLFGGLDGPPLYNLTTPTTMIGQVMIAALSIPGTYQVKNASPK